MRPHVVAHQVVVRLEVGVEPCGPGAEVAGLELAHRGQVVERLVHGPQGDGRHLDAHRGVHRLRGRVGRGGRQDPEDRLALGRDLQATGPELLGELVDRLHGGHPSALLLLVNNRC